MELYDKINRTDLEYEKEKTIHQLFEEQVEISGDRIAAQYRDDSITYKELNSRANQLAVKLRNAGAEANTIVGLMVTRSIDMLIGMLGILKSGACYLPIDPKFPKSRIEYMLSDSKAKILVTQHQVEQIEEYNGITIFLDDEEYGKHIENLPNINNSRDMAYVIYTSGSTGKPKGVMLEHQGVHNFIKGERKEIDFDIDKVLVSLTTISFDIFVLESLLPLTVGMKIVIADPMNFAEDMQGKTVQMLQTTPSTMLLILNDERNYEYLDSLTDIMLGGEAFPDRLLRQLQKMTTARIYNMYGPTETTVWSTIKELTHEDAITIGKPIANTQIYLVDEEYNIVRTGQEGEICIAGDGLARGYFERPELTAERFIYSKTSPEVRMYRTGDLGRIREDGDIEYLGRIDSQVKIRGFRIELGEIESAMQNLKEIKDSVVAAKENQYGEKYLVGYYMADQTLDVSYIIDRLKSVLPEYMVPGFYMLIDKIPLTPNGKINRLALPDIQLKRENLTLVSDYVEPVTELERELVTIWKNIFNLDEIGTEDEFFHLGGNSILIHKLHVALEKKYQKKFNIAELFVHTTVKQQCALIQDKEKKADYTKLQTIRLSQDCYTGGDNSLTTAQVSYQLDAKTCELLGRFAHAVQLSRESVYITLYMYILSKYSGQQEFMIGFGQNDCTEYELISQNLAETSDLEGLCKLIALKMGTKEHMITREALEHSIFEDRNEVIPSFIWDSKSGNDSIISNEISLSIEEQNSGAGLVLYFNRERMNQSRMAELLKDYIKLVKLVAAEVD